MSKNKNENKSVACVKKTSIGGQALIEGIMMRGPKMTAMAVRNPEGEMVLEKWETEAPKSKVTRIPIIRGVINFVLSMKFGYKCLMRSAEIAGLEEVADDANTKKDKVKKRRLKSEDMPTSEAKTVTESTEGLQEKIPEVNSAAEGEASAEVSETETKKEKNTGSSVLMTAVMVIATVLGVGLSIGLFVMLPTFIYKWSAGVMPFLAPENLALSSLVKSVFEGVLKIAILVAYMLLVTLMKDIRRTFQYHGAEHKTIFCYEHGKELTVENVRNERRFHPRCGTSFLILMLLVGMFISFFIDPLFIWLTGSVPATFIRALMKLILLPLIMGLGYELIKLAGRHDNTFTRIISAPGMWLQHITVLEPTDDMIECALTAFKEVLPKEERKKAEEAEETKESDNN